MSIHPPQAQAHPLPAQARHPRASQPCYPRPPFRRRCPRTSLTWTMPRSGKSAISRMRRCRSRRSPPLLRAPRPRPRRRRGLPRVRRPAPPPARSWTRPSHSPHHPPPPSSSSRPPRHPPPLGATPRRRRGASYTTPPPPTPSAPAGPLPPSPPSTPPTPARRRRRFLAGGTSARLGCRRSRRPSGRSRLRPLPPRGRRRCGKGRVKEGRG
ncbi:hypothetical protein C8R44DRAFT_823018 [Mycena epipterygia]|nr:hypothetical protein C8R44DRAFT_823018 [Mycena epipterygia]